MYTKASNAYLPSVLRTFALSLAIAFLGTAAGVFLPAGLFLPIAVLETGMLLFAFFLRRRKAISYPFLYVFTFLSGVTTFPIVAHYTAAAGGNTVFLALATTVTVFSGLSIYAAKTKKDLSFLGGMLLAALLALIAISIFSIFWPLSSTAMLAYSFIGVLVFSGYVLFDINMMKQHGVREEDVPMMALSLYLDFINLFISLLRIFGIISSRD
ncbi:MAG: Bax inhibitor-1/YccA family protein [Bacillota bacterium]|nr:Bax inhibitor-1/YccA family protein [Bacillota bacterium]MDP4169611.1 Bax inhibitor-1/YccA family protein [Bacillota bacterium]